MEYFAKFTRHIGTPRRTGGTTQLAKFEKAWKMVQSVCYYQSKWQGTPVETTPLPAQLQTMFDLLVQEDIAQAGTGDWTTGACMEYLLGNAVLDELVRLAEADQPLGVRAVVVSNLATFISLADDKLLVQKAVHNPVLDLLRRHGSPDPAQRADDSTFVDLLYAICSKIRGDPMLLNIFFQDRKWLRSVEQHSFSSDSIAAMMRSIESLRSTDSDASSGFEFLLFSHLLRFVHRDGAIGDTARTSLLFLLELATTEIMASTGGNTALELFILEDSGFAAILSATLGAMYSRLPRSLHVTSGPAAVVPESFPSYSADLQNAIESSIFTSDHRAPERWGEDRGPVSSASPEFRACLTAFASLLSFIQEVLYRCPSPHVCSQLLANLRSNFLQSILYPSLLESSDSDGSSVAVMRYLETMLQVARHEDLVSTIMDFLTDEGPASASPSDSATAGAACLPFTLRDLIYSNLQSSLSMDAVVSALNILRLILSKHCRYSSRLIEVERVQPSGIANAWMVNCTVTIDVHRQELAMYARMMSQLQSDVVEKRETPDAPLHIPWRHTTAAASSRPRTETRALMPELFAVGYDSYLEDAALGWDAHQAYHAEIDALFAAQSARDASLEPPSSAQPASSSSPTRAPPSAISAEKQRRMRPRKYSEAIMAPVQSQGGAKNEPGVAAIGGGDGGTTAQKRQQHFCQPSRHKYSVKPSDPIVRALMNLLTKYFAQPRECNLALTGVLAALVGCPFRTLDMWLGFNLPTLLAGVLSRPWAAWMDNLRNISDDEAQSASSDSEGEDNPRGSTGPRIRSGASAAAAAPYIATGGATANAMATANATKYVGLDRELQDAIRQLPHGATPPSLYLVLNGLVQQAMVLRTEIPDFARRLKRARNALMGVVEDVDDLDDELERSSPARQPATRHRDRGLSSASLESTRPGPIASPRANQTTFPESTTNTQSAAAVSRSRSTSTSTVRRQKQQQQQQLPLPSSGALSKDHLSPASNGNRARSNSATHASEAASSIQTASTGTNPRTPTSYADPASTPQSPWHAFSTPPANANLAEFLENVIILQESIKEIIARVQVRRENGGDENAVI
ncbi:hypothetical protein H4R20_002157 [Coemansia guatemalensis]|uniref:Retinoic acid induced 16-like protein n=1 Tax=Coemansia guatemalensis TaxID=2761395 RepID=A0A9W8I1Z1_9FUNG|nr:hypothetical protein H4R20_002157 [Coemansia guatemalensis]